MVLNNDFKEFIKLLNENGVKYLVVGGYAVAFYGYPRHTKDLDLWIWLDRENASNTIKTLVDFGFSSLGLTEDDFLDKENIIQLGYAPNRLDLIMDMSGIDFKTSYTRHIDVEFEGVKIKFINFDDLIINKKHSGRLQDLADIDKLEKVRKRKKKKK